MPTEHPLDLAETYWRNELDPTLTAEIARHLEACPDCRDAYESAAVAIAALRPWSNAGVDAALEEKLVALRPRPRRQWQMATAAGIMFLLGGAIGGVAGRMTASPPSVGSAPITQDSTLRTFMLLLEEPAWPPSQPLGLARDGYMDWVTNLQSLNRYAGAEKFTEEPGVRILLDGSVTTPRAENLSGWYLLRARNYEEAVALARLGPHLRYGSILVRQLE